MPRRLPFLLFPCFLLPTGGSSVMSYPELRKTGALLGLA